MTVEVISIREPISKVIAGYCGPVLTPEQDQTFNYCQTLGKVFLGLVDDDFVCCWGLIPPTFISTQAYLWMWAPEPIKHQLVFIRHSQIQVQDMLKRYDRIVGHCELRARSAQRWLRWLGAEFTAPDNPKFMPFTIRRKAA